MLERMNIGRYGTQFDELTSPQISLSSNVVFLGAFPGQFRRKEKNFIYRHMDRSLGQQHHQPRIVFIHCSTFFYSCYCYLCFCGPCMRFVIWVKFLELDVFERWHIGFHRYACRRMRHTQSANFDGGLPFICSFHRMPWSITEECLRGRHSHTHTHAQNMSCVHDTQWKQTKNHISTQVHTTRCTYDDSFLFFCILERFSMTFWLSESLCMLGTSFFSFFVIVQTNYIMSSGRVACCTIFTTK